ncbi:MAG: hypothetical protein AAF430_22645 [Myxococcota bacterium]
MTPPNAHRRARFQALVGLGVTLGLTALGCSTRWDAAGWAETRPELAGQPLGHLGDATPYVLPVAGELRWFLCRWSGDAPVPVAVSEAVSPAERVLIERALVAWEDAVPGLRFSRGGQGRVGIRVDIVPFRRRGARAAVDCRVSGVRASGAFAAEVVAAAVLIPRSEGDPFGRPVRLGEAELLGSLVHELGHALGLQGHAPGGESSVLAREAFEVRRVGARLLAGGRLDEPAMRALYAVPSGVVVLRQPVASELADASEGGWRVRLGDGAVEWSTETRPDLRYRMRFPAEVLDGTRAFAEAYEGPESLSPRSDRSRAPSGPGSTLPPPHRVP